MSITERSNPYIEGDKAHANGMHRSDNPYLKLAQQWDRGWIGRQVSEFTKSGKDTRVLKSFWRWIRED